MRINRPRVSFSDGLGCFLFGLLPFWMIALFEPAFYGDRQATVQWVGICLIPAMPLTIWLAFLMGRASAFDQLDKELANRKEPTP